MIEQVCLSEGLFQCAKEVFETMIFMDMQESDGPEQNIEGESLLGAITFSGDYEGCATICCGSACAKTIAANMLGLDPAAEVSREDICDAIGEVANMITGSVRARLQEDLGDVQVSIPTVIIGRELENTLGEGAVKVVVKVCIDDEYPAELSLIYRESSKK